MEKIEVGDTVRAKTDGGFPCISKGDEGTVQYISESGNPHVFFCGKHPDALCMYYHELDLIRKARKPEIKKEEANMKCEDCANYKAKERRPQVGDWVEVVRDSGLVGKGHRAIIERDDMCDIKRPPNRMAYQIKNKKGNSIWISVDDVRLCSSSLHFTITLPILNAILRKEYGDCEFTLDLAGTKVQL